MPKLSQIGHLGRLSGTGSSKRRYFYGLKVHMVTTAEGLPVEISLTPGSYNDTKHLRTFELDLPDGSVLYGGKPPGGYFTEDLLAEASGTSFSPIGRKPRSDRPKPTSNTSSRSIARKSKRD